MAVSTFRASCRKVTSTLPNGKTVTQGRDIFEAVGAPRGATVVECDETFEGADGVAALKAHMKTHGPRPVFKEPAPLKPFAWKAPRATKGGLDAVVERIAKGDYVFAGLFPAEAETLFEVEAA